MNLNNLLYISDLFLLEEIWANRARKLLKAYMADTYKVKALTLYNEMIRRLSYLRGINRKLDLNELFY